MVSLFSEIAVCETLGSLRRDITADIVADYALYSEVLRQALNASSMGETGTIEQKLDELLELKGKEGWKFLNAASQQQIGLISDMGLLIGNFHWLKYLDVAKKGASFSTLWHIYFSEVPDHELKPRANYLDSILADLYK